MGLRINQNIAAAQLVPQPVGHADGQMSKSLEKLSSGFRINRAADDAAGLAISEGLRSQVGGLKVAARNAQDGISVVQTAEGALTEVHSILQRMRDLAVQAANDTQQRRGSQRSIKTEVDALGDRARPRSRTSTNFNGTKLLDGADATVPSRSGRRPPTRSRIDTRRRTASFETRASPRSDVASTSTHVADVATVVTPRSAKRLDRSGPSSVRARTGSSTPSSNVNVAVENLSASESRIRDTDMAQEMVTFTRSQILSQAGTAMLAQANQAPQGVLSLLR